MTKTVRIVFSFLLFSCSAAYTQTSTEPQFAKLVTLFVYDSNKPMDVKETSVIRKDGVEIHDITYASPVLGRVNAFLIVPEGKGPFAGIVFGHWGLGTRSEFLPDATLYAKAGAVSLLIDYPWERTGSSRRGIDNMEKPQEDLEAYIQSVIDVRRGIDLLIARDDVDPDRIAYVGHSFGAQWGAVLSAIDKRLKTAVLMGGVGAQKDTLLDNPDPDFMNYRNNLPKGQLEAYLKTLSQVDALQYISHSTIPLLFQFANYERYFSKASMDLYYKTAANPKSVEWYDTGHDLNDYKALLNRSEWLRKYIRIEAIQLCK